MIVFVLRHADRTGEEVHLNVNGKKRAKLLARMLAESGVSVAFRSHYKRAEETLRPLEDKVPTLRGEEIVYEDADESIDYARKIATKVRSLPSTGVVAVIGHSDTVGPTIAELGGGPIDDLNPHEFDKLFVLFMAPGGSVSFLKLRYGEPT